MKRWKGVLLAVPAALMLMAAPGPAFASCAVSSTEQAVARAQVILTGRITDVDQRSKDTFYTVAVQRMYKGTTANPFILHVPAGSGLALSNDYRMQTDEVHTLYLQPDDKGYLTTNLCLGSHAGAATPDEVKAGLGEGSPAPPATPLKTVSPIRIWIPFIAVGLTAVAVGATLLSGKRRPS
jgi:hypothetical protein